MRSLKQTGSLKHPALSARSAATVATDPLVTGLVSNDVESALTELGHRATLIVGSDGKVYVQRGATTDSDTTG